MSEVGAGRPPSSLVFRAAPTLATTLIRLHNHHSNRTKVTPIWEGRWCKWELVGGVTWDTAVFPPASRGCVWIAHSLSSRGYILALAACNPAFSSVPPRPAVMAQNFFTFFKSRFFPYVFLTPGSNQHHRLMLLDFVIPDTNTQKLL